MSWQTEYIHAVYCCSEHQVLTDELYHDLCEHYDQLAIQLGIADPPPSEPILTPQEQAQIKCPDEWTEDGIPF